MSTTVGHVWKPSHARLVTIDSFIPVPRGTSAIAPPPLNWPTKDPGDVLDYVVDISPAIVGNDADGIATLSVTVSPSNPGDLLVQSAIADGSRIVVWLTQGQAGIIYTITFCVNTITGRSIQRSVLLPVQLLSTPLVLPNALITAAGIVLTDQNGNPVLAGN